MEKKKKKKRTRKMEEDNRFRDILVFLEGGLMLVPNLIGLMNLPTLCHYEDTCNTLLSIVSYLSHSIILKSCY